MAHTEGGLWAPLPWINGPDPHPAQEVGAPSARHACRKTGPRPGRLGSADWGSNPEALLPDQGSIGSWGYQEKEVRGTRVGWKSLERGGRGHAHTVRSRLHRLPATAQRNCFRRDQAAEEREGAGEEPPNRKADTNNWK